MESNIKFPARKAEADMTAVERARKWAAQRGLRAQDGGWLYYEGPDGYPVAMVQGYAYLASVLTDQGIITDTGIDWERGNAVSLPRLRQIVIRELAAVRSKTREARFHL